MPFGESIRFQIWNAYATILQSTMYYRLIQLIEVLKHQDRPPVRLICAVLNYNWFVSAMMLPKLTWNEKKAKKKEMSQMRKLFVRRKKRNLLITK